MESAFDCPACGHDGWREFRRYHYTRHGMTHRSEYFAVQHRVLFEVWFPDAGEVWLSAIYCERCGFATYSPRPTARDVENKYRFLQQHEHDIGGQKNDRRARRGDHIRARQVQYIVRRHIRLRGSHVLDFGGGNGKLLAPLQRSGARCFLVDYSLSPLPGIDKIGDTLDDVPPGLRFDAIICSHVLEHLGDPDVVLRRLAGLLADQGIIYGEVPAEIFGGIPIADGPVTHLNFFQRPSFATLFSRLGLGVIEVREQVGRYDADRLNVIRVVARRGPSQVAIKTGDGPALTERLIRPPSMARRLHLRWRLRMPPTAASVVRRLSGPVRTWFQ